MRSWISLPIETVHSIVDDALILKLDFLQRMSDG